MNQPDRVREGPAILRDKGHFAVAKVPLERLAKIPGPSTSNQGTSDMGSADGASGSLLEHRLERDGNIERIEAVDDSLRPIDAHLANGDQPVLELRQIAQVQAEDVRLGIVFHSAQLDAVDDTQAELRPRGSRVGQARQGIVIGERNGHEASRLRGARDIRGRAGSVGRGGMRVKVDEVVL